ncbi:hypothetical protein [Bosea sp. PAMC 26642]|uniref:hypothetical protein n=1 Tax=Bosea sp. (strain PAMC 26642) TaxID=1792307 RepID=UPI0007705711|nr:hypothetical protein [Bosea sp. PAMC 26642]AMJ62783.1 hypothetical protein AXW83_23025 [Bosea sp. PAMC 26642]
MTQTITRSYETHDAASSVVANLEAAGTSSSDISVVSNHADGRDSNAPEGAGIGGVVGGAAGLLAGLGMLAIPGIGPVVAAGWLASTAAGAAVGAATGGLLGALTSAGVSDDDAHYYAETVRRGGSVVSVRAADDRAASIEAIMDGASPLDPTARRAEYQRDGWTRFDENAGPYRPPVV